MIERFSALHRVVMVLLVLTMAVPSPSQGQVSGEMASELLEAAQTNPLLLLRQRLSQSALAASGIPLEGAVDPAAYIVGPGDAFTVVINGQDVLGAPIPVGADGRLPLPDAGLVAIGGMSLEAARTQVQEALASYYEGAQTDISLTQSRQFYVHVTGAVPVPGRYLALPVSRVSNALELAFADTSALASTNPDFQPSLRNVEVRHKNGSSSHIDMVRYLTAGDTDANPYLMDGDVVHVPSFNPEYRSVSVGGRIPFPGMYEFRQGDSLDDLLAMVGGLPDDDGVGSVVVTRLTGDGPESHAFTPEDLTDGAGSSFMLMALDVVSISERQDARGIVRLEGRVARPGSYPIVDGKPTLQQLLEAAGGLQDDALPRAAVLERRSLTRAPDSNVPTDRNMSSEKVIRQMLRQDSVDVFQRLRLTDLDFMSRTYFLRELEFQHRVSMDLEAVLNGSAADVPLRSGDRLVVPRDERSVYVFGQVVQPGYIPVNAGQSARYYLAQAGGLSAVAGRTLVINPATGAVQEDLDHVLRSGDILFVDKDANVADDPDLERLIIERERARADARIRTMQAIFQGVGTLASLITLIITIRRN